MKTINTVKYIFLSLIILGCFANFAHNEYGLTIIKYCLAGLFLVFLTESVFAKIKLKSTYVFIEALFIALFCLGYLLVDMFEAAKYWPLAALILTISALFLTVFYIARGIRILVKERKHSLPIALLTFGVYLWFGLMFTGSLFKFLHFPGANWLLYMNIILFFLLIIPALLKYNYAGKKIRFFTYLKTLNGNIRLLLIVFSVVSLYITLTIADIAPRFYSLATPPALEKLSIQAVKGGDKEAIYRYWATYHNFLDNREQAEQKSK